MIDTPDLMLQTLDAGNKNVDALSDVLRVTQLSGGVFLEAEFTAPWCNSGKVPPEDCKPFLAAPRHVIAFHFVTTGCMQLRVGDGAAIEARAGEVVLLPHNEIHIFGSEPPRPQATMMSVRSPSAAATVPDSRSMPTPTIVPNTSARPNPIPRIRRRGRTVVVVIVAPVSCRPWSMPVDGCTDKRLSVFRQACGRTTHGRLGNREPGACPA
jgi:Cupin